jgi:serine/threonine-protein kinase HipA
MISEAFVWIYLPKHTEPVVCGRLFAREDGAYSFVYGRSYRDRRDSIPPSPDTMPLGANLFTGRRAGALPGPIRDASPDAWGRYVAEYRRGGAPLDELDVLLSGDGDRIGALAFSNSATECRAPESPPVTLVDMEAAARGVQEGQPLPRELVDALLHGTSIGGARPKAIITVDGDHWIAKFSSATDQYRVVRWEAATLSLARAAGIRVPRYRLEQVNGRDVLLVERFDREHTNGVRRHLMLSALTLLDLDDTEATLASYPDLSEVLLRHARDSTADRAELFRRMVFNILVGNEDDHAKNHACFWDGLHLRLTPAYDLLPQRRAGMEGRQAMIVGALGSGGRESTLANALTSAARFGLDPDEAGAIAEDVLRVVREQWEQRFADVQVPRNEIDALRGTSMLSPLAVEIGNLTPFSRT